MQTRIKHPNPPASSPRAGTHSLRYCGSVTCKRADRRHTQEYYVIRFERPHSRCDDCRRFSFILHFIFIAQLNRIASLRVFVVSVAPWETAAVHNVAIVILSVSLLHHDFISKIETVKLSIFYFTLFVSLDKFDVSLMQLIFKVGSVSECVPSRSNLSRHFI